MKKILVMLAVLSMLVTACQSQTIYRQHFTTNLLSPDTNQFGTGTNTFSIKRGASITNLSGSIGGLVAGGTLIIGSSDDPDDGAISFEMYDVLGPIGAALYFYYATNEPALTNMLEIRANKVGIYPRSGTSANLVVSGDGLFSGVVQAGNVATNDTETAAAFKIKSFDTGTKAFRILDSANTEKFNIGTNGVVTGDGSGLTNLAADALSSGQVPDARMTNSALLNAENKFTAVSNTFDGPIWIEGFKVAEWPDTQDMLWFEDGIAVGDTTFRSTSSSVITFSGQLNLTGYGLPTIFTVYGDDPNPTVSGALWQADLQTNSITATLVPSNEDGYSSVQTVKRIDNVQSNVLTLVVSGGGTIDGYPSRYVAPGSSASFYSTDGINMLTYSGSVVMYQQYTNAPSFDVWTTNVFARSHLDCSLILSNAATCQLVVEQGGGITNTFTMQQVSTGTNIDYKAVSCRLQPGARFIFTNLAGTSAFEQYLKSNE